MMQYKILSYEPAVLFHFFEEISAIPRGSGHEKAISDYLVQFAQARGLSVTQDDAWNIVIRKPAAKGYENAPAVMLQGHLDMVCEKDADTVHDFETQGIELVVENGILHANGTTLGGDNGVAVALMMTILDDASLQHPALECVFTTEEEIGLNGARTLDKSQLTARTMINLDSEEEGVATVSCAGGMRFALHRTPMRETAHGDCIQVDITGLLGGHSGSDIDLERVNAIKLMARLLHRVLAVPQTGLISLAGGSKDNAIPRECRATLVTEHADAVLEIIQSMYAQFQNEILLTEPDFKFSIQHERDKPIQALSSADGLALVNTICLAPNGVRRRNPKQDNFVVTSLNLGTVSTDGEQIKIVFAPRSSLASLQDETVDILQLLADTFGFQTSTTGRYPGWAFTEHSPIRAVFCDSYRRLFGTELKIEAIHAGLECGLFSDAMPGLDAIAVGPTIQNCHTPNEQLPLDSLSRFYSLLTDVLAHLKS